jgi:hypothetical protein
LVAQYQLSQPSAALAIGAGLCAAIVFVAPVSWRLLLPEGRRSSSLLIRFALYGAVAVGTVLTVGAAIPKSLDIPVTFMTSRPALADLTALFLFAGWLLGRDIGFEHSLAREKARADALEREAERAQLLALRAHLDPHFLFNTLNSIAEWCRQDGEVAERAVLELSAMLRTVFAGVKSASWPLGEELKLVQTLFALHKLRDPDRYALEVSADPSLAGILVPPLILLPLAENAITHGPFAGHAGPIAMRTERRGERLVIQLENPGPYQGPRPGGSGLSTVERRLDLAYRGDARMSITGLEGRTRVEVDVPTTGPSPGGAT